MILGTGLDLVEVARIADLAERHGDRFLKRVFTEAELAYCLPRAARNTHLAGRFAAKEAVFKALGTGWSETVSWKQIEVLPGPSGAPEVNLSRGARERFEAMGGRRLLVSITHTADLAAASATIEG
ncbi:MAG TPA: holo-ACP synthase [Planctomycetota bacterium]|nr:holo-ACP synthase [Planctomycetota bacterium]